MHVRKLVVSVPPAHYYTAYVQDDLRQYYIHEVMLGQVPPNRVKLLVCGAAGVGKTELTDSLKCHLLRSLFRRRSPSSLTQMILKRTYGMTVQQVAIPNAGNFSVWDFSGMKDYYAAHENFLRLTNAVAMVVFSLRDSVEKQLAQVRFWLAMIKSKQPPDEVIRFAGENPDKPHVLLVGSFADQQHLHSAIQQQQRRQLPTLGQASLRGVAVGGGEESEDVFAVPLASSILGQEEGGADKRGGEGPPDDGRTVLRKMREEFGDHFEFDDHVFALDCRLSQTAAMKHLRERLGVLRLSVLKVRLVYVCLALCLQAALLYPYFQYTITCSNLASQMFQYAKVISIIKRLYSISILGVEA